MKMLIPVLIIMSMFTGCNSDHQDDKATKPSVKYMMPAESSPHEGTWLQWPHQYQYGVTYRNRIEPTWIAMTRELVSGEKVHIIAYNEEVKQDIIGKLTTANIPQDKVDFYIFKTNDVWVRDNGPIYVRSIRGGGLTIEGWGFNGWGGKEPYAYSELIPSEVAKATQMPFVQLNNKMILEGGAVELDGKGSLMATRSSTLHKNRNLGMTQAEAETLFTTYLGATHFIWLNGKPGVDITDMHIDGFARFGEANQIVTMNPDDLLYWELSQKDIDYLYSARNPQGESYEYVVLPLSKNNVITTYGKDLGYRGSYVNYYISNDKILIPTYNDPNDEVAIAIIQKLYPTRKAVGIDVRNLYADGGMVHCVTQQQPKK